LMTRTFFSLQRPWVPASIAALNLALTALGSLALYKPFGIAGIVAATAIATAASVLAQALILRRQLNGLELGSLIDGTVRIAVGSAVLAAVCLAVWSGLDAEFGEGIGAQILAVGVALSAGALAYLGVVLALRVPEARQLIGVVRRR
jgi:putative peptidoglycan lipid II flippase